MKPEANATTEIYKDATILVTLSALPSSPDDCPNLKLIHFLSAGTNHVADSPIYKDTDITLTTSSGIHGRHTTPDILCNLRYAILANHQDTEQARRFPSGS